MKHKIEQEIERTLNCLSQPDVIQVGPQFIDSVSGKLSRIHRRPGCNRSKTAFPVAVIFMVILNITLFITDLKYNKTSDNTAIDSTAVMANEYGMGQNNLVP